MAARLKVEWAWSVETIFCRRLNTAGLIIVKLPAVPAGCAPPAACAMADHLLATCTILAPAAMLHPAASGGDSSSTAGSAAYWPGRRQGALALRAAPGRPRRVCGIRTS